MKKIFIPVIIILVGIAGYFAFLSQRSANDSHTSKPVITTMDILHASDLEAGVQSAVKNNDNDAVMHWLEKAREVGEAAGLPEKDLDYLTSEQAQSFVKFNASRDLFNKEFEKRYYQLGDIDDLKAKYPEAKDIFPRADALLEKRDNIIQQIAMTLANGKTADKEQLDEAKMLWKEKYNTTKGTSKNTDKPLIDSE